MTKEEAIKSFKKYIIFQESTLNDYYKIDEEFYKDKIEQLELSTTLLKTVLSMLEEQDKIIDLMAEMLNNHDIDEDICKQMGEKENCNEFIDKENCKACIKQYFENKAKESE